MDLFTRLEIMEALELRNVIFVGHSVSGMIGMLASTDPHGHPVGDSILTKLAGILQSLSGGNDVVARYGGEEFVVILAETDQEQAIQKAERYCETIAATLLAGYAITVSIGAATVSAEDKDVTLLLKADSALYASKSGGRNRMTHSAHIS